MREYFLDSKGCVAMVWTSHEVDITRPRSKAYRSAQWATPTTRHINTLPDRDGVYRRAVAYWHQIARKSK
jgi:hypothetical protein